MLGSTQISRRGVMSRWPLQVSRRKFLRSTTLGVTAVAGLLHAPAILRAQGGVVKIGVLHPVSGALSYSGQQGRLGATMAIDDVNTSGGIKAPSGATFDPMLAAPHPPPDGDNSQPENMNAAGVFSLVGGYASAI